MSRRGECPGQGQRRVGIQRHSNAGRNRLREFGGWLDRGGSHGGILRHPAANQCCITFRGNEPEGFPSTSRCIDARRCSFSLTTVRREASPGGFTVTRL